MTYKLSARTQFKIADVIVASAMKRGVDISSKDDALAVWDELSRRLSLSGQANQATLVNNMILAYKYASDSTRETVLKTVMKRVRKTH